MSDEAGYKELPGCSENLEVFGRPPAAGTSPASAASASPVSGYAAPSSSLPSMAALPEGFAKAVVAGALGGLVGLFRCVAFGLCYATNSGAEVEPILVSLFLSGLTAQLVYLYRRHPLPGIIAGPASVAVPFTVPIARAAVEGAPSANAAAMRVILATSIVSGLNAAICKLCMSFAKHLDVAKATFPQPVLQGLFAALGVSLTMDGLGICPNMLLALAAGVISRALPFLPGGKHPLTFPSWLVLQVAGFHVFLLFSGLSLEEGRERGWLFEPFQAVSLPTFLAKWLSIFDPAVENPAGLGLTDVWGLLGRVLPLVVALLPMLLLDLLVGCTLPLEVLTRRSLPCEGELRTCSFSSFVCSLLGGNVSYVTVSPTKLTYDAGGGEVFAAGWAAASIWAFALTPYGTKLVGLCPRFMVAGLLIYISLGFLMEGLYAPRRLMREAPVEYGVILFTFLVSVWQGLAHAIFCGFLLLAVLFTVRYARGAHVTQLAQSAGTAIEGSEVGDGHHVLRSKKYRSHEDWRFLQPDLARKVFVLRTNVSHLFFASITPTLSQAPLQPPVRFLILDLSSVRTLDSSALAVLQALPPFITVLLAALPKKLRSTSRSIAPHLRQFAFLDDALEWCEEQLLWERRRGEGASSSSNHREPQHFWRRHDIPQSGRRIADVAFPCRLTLEETCNVLQQCFEAATPSLLQCLADDTLGLTKRRMLQAFEVAFEEHHHGSNMVICLSGSLSLYKGPIRVPQLIHPTLGVDPGVKVGIGTPNVTTTFSSEDLAQSSVGQRIGSIGPGDALFEAALVRPCACAYSGVADEPTELLTISRAAVAEMDRASAAGGEMSRLATDFWKALAYRVSSSRDDVEVVSRAHRNMSL